MATPDPIPAGNSGSTTPLPKENPRHVPDHQLLRVVGRGSYGEVWLARSLTGAFRAIKIVTCVGGTESRAFGREFGGIQRFEPISRAHPSLVSILHVGRGPDFFYYIMEVADDQASGQAIDPATYAPLTLSALLRRGRVPLLQTASVGLNLAGALSFLHDHGLIHRDLKPANIIFVQNQPKLADIGLVTAIAEKATAVGTEGYLPPEGPGRPAADIYALGKVLYQMVTGRDCADFPELPTDLRHWPDGREAMRLNDLVLRACAEDAGARIGSADELHRELLAIYEALGGTKSVAAPPTSVPSSARLGRAVIFSPGNGAETRSIVQRLREILQARQWKVELEEKAELSGSWARRIEETVAEADLIFLLMSPEAWANECTAYLAELISRRRDQSPASVFVITPSASDTLPPGYRMPLASAQRLEFNLLNDANALGSLVPHAG